MERQIAKNLLVLSEATPLSDLISSLSEPESHSSDLPVLEENRSDHCVQGDEGNGHNESRR